MYSFGLFVIVYMLLFSVYSFLKTIPVLFIVQAADVRLRGPRRGPGITLFDILSYIR